MNYLTHKAPLSTRIRDQLSRDAIDVRGCAKRKGLSLDAWEEREEGTLATLFFELGCWLHYFSRRVGLAGAEGLKARVECLDTLFRAGFRTPGYKFYTVFDFGERQFDTCVEMGDAKQVIDLLRERIPGDESGNLRTAFKYYGWPVETAEEKDRPAFELI